MPARVLRACAARRGDLRRKHLAPWDLVEAIDEANGNKAARSIYRRLYVPLSNYTVHASGGTLLRHVHRKGSLRWRPSRAWARRSPARVADAAAGFLAADLAEHPAEQAAEQPHVVPHRLWHPITVTVPADRLPFHALHAASVAKRPLTALPPSGYP